MESNNLYPIALSDASDDEILRHFLRAQLPDTLVADFFTFFEATKSPIAIRSSSLLEDAHYQPFAGIYSTYMIPYLEDKYQMLQMLACAIKGVYASVFYRDSKAYMTATSNVIDQEKMAVILQQVVGNDYGTRFYPTMSGVLRSLNYYPIGDETAEEGIASLALGLGKYIVDGGQTLRVSPYQLHRLYLRPLRPSHQRRRVRRGSQADHLCQCAATWCSSPSRDSSDVHAVWFRSHAPPRRDRVCLQYPCRPHL